MTIKTLGTSKIPPSAANTDKQTYIETNSSIIFFVYYPSIYVHCPSFVHLLSKNVYLLFKYCLIALTTNKHTDRQTNENTDKHTDRQTNKHTDRHTDKQTFIQTYI